MSFKRSVFYRVGRPAPKPVPLDVIARVGHTHIPAEPAKDETKEETTQQTDINKLTQAITDAIDKALGPKDKPTDPTDDSEGGQQNNTTSSTSTSQVPVINDDKIVVEPLSPSYDEAVENDEENLKNLDPVLHNYIRKQNASIPIIRVDNPADAARNHPLQDKVVICTTSFDSGEVRYKVYERSSTTGGVANTDFKEFKRLVTDYNKKILNGQKVKGTTAVARFVK